MTKADLRARARAHRKRLHAADPDAAGRAADHASAMLDALFGREAARGRRLTVAVYCARGSEIDAAPLARALVALGCDLCLPCVEAMDAPLVFRAWTPGDPLAPDLVGSAAPPPGAPLVDPDLIVTPLVAFDAFGGRLGQGGGYYDRTFAARPGARRVGLAWAGQALDRVPREPHDIALDGILTDLGYAAPCISH